MPLKKPVISLIKLRRARRERVLDANNAIELMNKSKSKFLATPRNVRELIRDKREWFFIRNSKGEKIGTVSIDLKKGEIGGFSLLSKYRNPKNSFPALRKAESILKETGHKKAIARVAKNSDKTIRTLIYLGYEQVRKLTRTKYGQTVDLIELEKRLV